MGSREIGEWFRLIWWKCQVLGAHTCLSPDVDECISMAVSCGKSVQGYGRKRHVDVADDCIVFAYVCIA